MIITSKHPQCFIIFFVLLLVSSPSLGHLTNDGPENYTVFETKVIYKKPGKYIGWPTITKTDDGELIVVFSGEREAHVCPWGVVQAIRSDDNGKTWSKKAVIFSDTLLDDRDAGLLETRSGALLLSWFTSVAFDNEKYFKDHPDWQLRAASISPELREKLLGNWVRRSTDNGRTWEAPVKQIVSAPHGPIELSDGRLLYIGNGFVNDIKILGVEVSGDDGQTWQLVTTLAIPENESVRHYWEPHVVELRNGKLIALFRYQPEDHSQSFLRQTESSDGGKNWTELHKTPIWGYPPHIIQLTNGWLLAVYGVRRDPYSERACISKDGGKTWDIGNEIVLNIAVNWDLGYPSSVQLDDDSILTVFYEVDEAGGKTCLKSTHWILK